LLKNWIQTPLGLKPSKKRKPLSQRWKRCATQKRVLQNCEGVAYFWCDHFSCDQFSCGHVSVDQRRSWKIALFQIFKESSDQPAIAGFGA
jgi:hypothetical protein